MKKAIILLICILTVFLVAPSAVAETSDTYYKITDDTTVFKYDSTYTPIDLFTLKSGCYVKLIEEKGSYYRVEYFGATGLIDKAKITDTTSYSNLSQYYHNQILINITQDAVTNQRNYLTRTPMDSLGDTILEASDSLTLIGTIDLNQVTYLYVSVVKDGTVKFGSIQASYTNWDNTSAPITPPATATTPTPEPAPGGVTVTPSTDGTGGEEPTNNLVRVILIIGICIPAFLIVYLIFKPVKSTKERYSDSNPKRRGEDYEDFE